MRTFEPIVWAGSLLLASALLAGPVCARGADADALPRHGLLGTALASKGDAVTITAVIPASAAARAGLQPGDVIVRVDGVPIATVRDALTQLHRPAGTSVSLIVRRAGQDMSVTAQLSAPPPEQSPGVETLYRSIDVDGTLRRVLLTVPQSSSGRLPAVMLIGGIGCFSIDTADPQDGYKNVARDLSRRGFVTLRLEKSGVGDSQGPPCATVDFDTEMHSYEVALHWLLQSPLVDASHVYLLGHSIGGVIAPRLALDNPVAGVIVAETVGSNWYEYELANARRQQVLGGSTPPETDDAMHVAQRCIYRLEVARESYDAITASDPQCKSWLAIYPVPAAYMQQVAALNIAAPWASLNVPVLAIYGKSDFVTDEADHRAIVATVNARHTDTATLEIIAGMDHYLAQADTQQASLARLAKQSAGTYDAEFSAVVTAWLCRQAPCRPRVPFSL